MKVQQKCIQAGLLSALLLASSVWAQSFPIVPPKLSPRTGGATPPAQTYPGQAAPPQPAQNYGNAGTSGSGQPAGTSYGNTSYGNASYGNASYGNPAYGSSPGNLAPPSSPLGSAPTAAYGAGTHSANLPPATVVQPERAPEGLCRVALSPDRQTLELVSGAQALARNHVPLGEYRAQLVTHSPDGRWAVAYTKLRGAPQYAALVIDLERCGTGQIYELSGAGQSVGFEADNAVLKFASGEMRIDLRAGRVQ